MAQITCGTLRKMKINKDEMDRVVTSTKYMGSFHGVSNDLYRTAEYAKNILRNYQCMRVR